jgi:hypothetical protein
MRWQTDVKGVVRSMIPKKPAPDLIRGGNRFSEKIMLKQKPGPALRYSALMLASRITLPHFAESARMRAAKSSGELMIE